MLYPPATPLNYFKRKLRNPNLTLPQRIRRMRKQAKRKIERHEKLFRELISPAAISVARVGFIPPHLENPVSKQEVRRFIDECNAAFFYAIWADRGDCLNVMNGAPEIAPKLPGCPRPMNGGDASQEALRPDLAPLLNAHALCLPALRNWFVWGRARYFYKTIYQKSIKRAAGEWSVMYPFEMKEAFPSVSFEKGNYRQWYLVQCVRDPNGAIYEIRVYSSSYAPLFRMECKLAEGAVIPEKYQDWWNDRLNTLPPYRKQDQEDLRRMDEASRDDTFVPEPL